MLKKWIIQKLTICDRCGREMPEGDNCYFEENGEVICLECEHEETGGNLG